MRRIIKVLFHIGKSFDVEGHKYSIMENEGGGDCFFAVLRDALKTLELDKSTFKFNHINKYTYVQEPVQTLFLRFEDLQYTTKYILPKFGIFNNTKTTVSLRESSLTRISFSGITLNCSNNILPFINMIWNSVTTKTG